MSEIAARRSELVTRSMDSVREIVGGRGVSRDTLAEVKDILVAMTREPELFAEGDFPTPTPEEVAKIYLLSDRSGGEFSLYLISVLPLGPSPIHDHGTFAVIAGMAGEEENVVYRRVDDGSAPGKATVEEDFRVVLRNGDAIAFLPEDIHRIDVVSETPTRHFHLYGKGFDQQTERLEFDPVTGTTRSAVGSLIPIDESRRVG
jgi:predicted metal-dependent enzyme (double-stranded beta helix superfamily)